MDPQNGKLDGLWAAMPLDLALRIISLMPSPLLFDCRTLSKAFRACALQTLTRRPFFVYQKPSSECYLLPLDALSTPLLSTFKLSNPSFTLFSTSSNLICLQRKSESLLIVSVCSIFCKWKVTLPAIVHPEYAPRFRRRVFTEDSNVDSLKLVVFEALLNEESSECVDGHGNEGFLDDHDPHESAHGPQLPCDVCLGHHNFRVIAVTNTYARVFDSRQQAWSDPIYQLADIYAQALPQFKIDGIPVKFVFNDRKPQLRITFPHVEGVDRSTYEHGIVVEGVCENGRSPLLHRPHRVFRISSQHQHTYTRESLYKEAYAFRSKLYFVVVEKERIICSRRVHSMAQQGNIAFYTMQPEDMETYVCTPKSWDKDFACEKKFPASTTCILSLCIADIDTINWTMQFQKKNGTALLEVSNMWDIPYPSTPGSIGKFLLVEGLASCR